MAKTSSVSISTDQSLDALRTLVVDKIRSAYGGNGPEEFAIWIREFYADRAIAELGDGKLYEIAFTQQGTDIVLGQKTEVKVAYKAAEAAIKVAESSVQELNADQISKDGMTWDIQIIRSGPTLTANKDLGAFDPALKGRMGRRNYSAESLRDAVKRGVFNAVPFVLRDKEAHLGTANNPMGLRMMRENEQFERIAGVTLGNYIAEEANGAVAVRAKLHLKEGEIGRQVRQDLLTLEKQRNAAGESAAQGLVDVSWTGDAESVLATSPFVADPIIDVTRINEAVTVDPCLVGNAGGFIMKAAEAAATKKPMPKKKASAPMPKMKKKAMSQAAESRLRAEAIAILNPILSIQPKSKLEWQAVAESVLNTGKLGDIIIANAAAECGAGKPGPCKTGQSGVRHDMGANPNHPKNKKTYSFKPNKEEKTAAAKKHAKVHGTAKHGIGVRFTP
jgi:hypothetical protein